MQESTGWNGGDPITLPMATRPPQGRPTWVTVLGVVGVLFAGIELASALLTPINIMSMRMQRQLMSNPQFMAGLTPATMPATGPAAAPTTQQAAALLVAISQPSAKEGYVIAAGAQSIIAGVVLLVGSIQLLRERSVARAWLLGYAWLGVASMLAFVAIGFHDPDPIIAGLGTCGVACYVPIVIALFVMLYLPEQRAYFHQLRSQGR